MDAVVFQVVLFSTVGTCVYVLRRLRRRVRRRECSKATAVLWYATVGSEELTGKSWISELFARSMIPVGAIAAGLALMANVAFVVSLAMMRASPRSSGLYYNPNWLPFD